MKKVPGLPGILLVTAGIFWLCQSPIFAHELNDLVKTPKLYYQEGAHLLTGECAFILPANPDRRDENIGSLLITELGAQGVGVKPDGTVGRRSESTIPTLRPLYPVYLFAERSGKSYVHCLFRLPVTSTGIEKKTKKWEVQKIELRNVHRYAYGNSIQYPGGGSGKAFHFQVVRADEEVKAADQKWQAAFKRFLLSEIRTNEDHEMELLQYLRWFGEVPKDPSAQHWKRSESLRFVFMMCGLNDIRDALPSDPKGKLEPHLYTSDPPKPILLPQVEAKEVALDDGISQLGRWVPRSCYFVEWPGVAEFLKTISYAGRQFEAWSPGTHPRTIPSLVDHHLGRLGLTKEFLKQNQKKIGSVALAGWDPYFQSGTNILLLLDTTEDLSAPEKAPFMFRAENALLLSTGEKLLKMGRKAHERGRSLRQVDNFRYARGRLKAGQDGEKENVFIYLSDYWFTNFISPRWWIQTRRRNQLDARLRLAFLLKKVWQQESGAASLPDLSELRKAKALPQGIVEWLLADLTDGPGGMAHKDLGGLYQHPPIDTLPFLPFESVSKSELKDYESFRRVYVGRWRQMDPVALQVVETGDGKAWKSRLYISPISRRSEFTMIAGFLPKKKLRHRYRKIEGEALGISFAVSSRMYQPFLRGVKLPLEFFIQAMAFDFAPRSMAASQWLEKRGAQDEISGYRVPGAVVAPEIILSALAPMAGGLRRMPSGYDNIDLMEFPPEPNYFPLMVTSPQDTGMAFVSMDPITLSRIRKGIAREETEDKVPCDLRLFADLKYGYMLRRKILQEAVKNRTIAAWRRENRMFRIHRLLGTDETRAADKSWVKRMGAEHIFPNHNKALEYLTRVMPRLKTHRLPGSSGYSSSAKGAFHHLPEFLLKLQRIDAFVSVEPNALFFENHYAFFPATPAAPRQTPPATPPSAPGTAREGEGLDFDEE